MNGDGFGDIVVGAYGVNAYAGAAYVYFGGSKGLSDATFTSLTAPSGPGAEFGVDRGERPRHGSPTAEMIAVCFGSNFEGELGIGSTGSPEAGVYTVLDVDGGASLPGVARIYADVTKHVPHTTSEFTLEIAVLSPRIAPSFVGFAARGLRSARRMAGVGLVHHRSPPGATPSDGMRAPARRC